MRAVASTILSASLMALALIGLTPPASAAPTWNFPNGTFTLSDVLGETASLSISNMTVTGTSASGYLDLSRGRYSCTTRSFSGLTATFTLGSFDPCYGTVTFAVDSSGLLTVSGNSVYIPATLLTVPGTGSVQGTQPAPTVVPLTNCLLTFDKSRPALTASWDANADAATYDFKLHGGGGTDYAGLTSTSVEIDSSIVNFDLPPGSWEEYRADVTAKRADGATVATCSATTTLATPNAPVIDSTVPVPSGGLLTVNYSLPTTLFLQGIEYRIDNGPWTRPGGTAPTNGANGSFTIPGITQKKFMLTLRSVGTSANGEFTAEGTPEPVVFAAAPTKGSGGTPASSTTRPNLGGSPTVIGATPQAPVTPPPAKPASSVPGTSNGAGTGTPGALAATTGNADIDAPCLAKDGTLYPTLYGTIGSQLTMAPNTHGLSSPTTFTVVGGALPAGIQLDRTYGVLFGVPTQAGSWATTIRAGFADGTSKDGAFTTRIDADAQTLQYASQNIGSVNSPISIEASTNAPAVGTAYRLVCGELPAGTTLDAKTGSIIGTPTSVVTMPVPLRIAETSATGKAAASFILVVDQAGVHRLSYPAHPHLRVGKRVTIRPTVSGVTDIVEFRTWLGKLPRGLHLDHRTGVITGKVLHVGRPHSITLVAQTKAGALLTAAPMRLTITR